MTSNGDWHTKQIEEYRSEFKIYSIYAEAMGKMLKEACRRYAPEAIVEVRAKSLSSFAEKAIRKRKDHDDPVHQFTDLCGARVITQTQAEVDLICKFIKENFKIDEANSPDIRSRLQAAEFGYLSVHFVVQVKADPILGISMPKEIGDRRAEVQVRTLLQHAYAGVTHDRLYKSEFDPPENLKRDLARVAAILEEADGTLAQAVERLDAYKLNYGTFLKQEDREKEIKALETVLRYEPVEANKPRTALRLVKILKQTWEWEKIIAHLDPFVSLLCLEKAEICLEHGYALCRAHRVRPDSDEYRQGQAEMEWASQHGKGRVQVLALACLAWSYRNMGDLEVEARKKARKLYHQAHHTDPYNPYVLSSHLEYEIYCRKNRDFVQSLRLTLLNAMEACRAHADARIEIPWAYFCIGRFQLLLGQAYESLGAYAKAIHLCTDENFCVPAQILEEEIEFLNLINSGEDFPEEHQWVQQLLLLGKSIQVSKDHPSEKIKTLSGGKRSFKTPIVIVAGGTDETVKQEMLQYNDLLIASFEGFRGTIISGGTTAGISGLVGALAEQLREKGIRDFRAIGYVPRLIPAGVAKDLRYDETIDTCGRDFTPCEPLQSWIDLIAAGVKASEIRVLGINGGRIAAFEYRLALALGASVGIIESSGRAASDLLPDADWWNAKKLLRLPQDRMAVRAFVQGTKDGLERARLEAAAKLVHAKYLEGNKNKAQDPALLPWEFLSEEIRESNRQQVIYSLRVLRQFDYDVRDQSTGYKFPGFSDEEVGQMAEMEHGRWIVERLLDGWKYGPTRDHKKKISPFLVAWTNLANEIKKYDLDAVKGWPEVLEKAGLEIYKVHSKK